MNPNLKLMAFQETGSDYLAQRSRGFLIWEPGVGKTPTTVRACMKAGAARILVFCPPIAVSVWEQHFLDWSTYQVRAMGATEALRPFQFFPGTGVRIVPYSRTRADARVMLAARKDVNWDAVILDEAHYLKSSNAQRTRAIYGKNIDLAGTPLENAKHIWALSGTPILNHPAEFWTHLRALTPEVLYFSRDLPLMTEDFFVSRYCVTRPTPYGVRIMGGRNASELAARIKSVADRKRLKDVITDMPELRIVEHPLPADTQIDPALRHELDHELRQLRQAGTDVSALDDDEALLATIQAGQIAFSTVRRLIGRAKLKPVAELIADMLQDGEDDKIVVFCHHREVISGLADLLKRYAPLVIHGGTALAARASYIRLFQTDPKMRLIILAIDAAGESITLHAAHNVLIVEPSPVPARNHQAIARAHRQGQKNPVIARFVLLPGTLDARLMSIIARKTREIARLIDGKSSAEQKSAAAEEAALAFPADI